MQICTVCKENLNDNQFYKNGYRCISCDKAAGKKYRESQSAKKKKEEYNKSSAKKRHNKRYESSWGYGVYAATFPSGVYIGSGALRPRHNKHHRGMSGIAKTLGEHAIDFQVILRCSCDNCCTYEQLVIDYIGIESLLNKNSAEAH